MSGIHPELRSLKALFAAAGAAALLALPSTEAAATCVPEPYLASVCATASVYCPRGYSVMAGQELAISNNQALFSLVGCRWGGDCRVSFKLPDMRGRSPMGVGTGPGLTPIALGQTRGAETVTLTTAQMPSHSHGATFTTAGVGSAASVKAFDGNGVSSTPSAENKHLQTVAANPFSPSTTANLYGTGNGNPVELGGVSGSAGSGGTVSIANTGLGRSFPVEGPVAAVTYCIAVTGLYPPRP